MSNKKEHFISPFYRATLVSRIPVLIGGLVITLRVALCIECLANPMQATLGGALGLVGAVWFLIAARRARR